MLLGVTLLAFLAGALLALGLATPGARRGVLEARLDRIGRPVGPPAEAAPDTELAAPFAERMLRPLRARGAAALERAVSRGTVRATRALLERAGSPAGLGPGEFLGLRALCALLFLALAPAAFHLLGTSLPMKIAALGLDLMIGLALRAVAAAITADAASSKLNLLGLRAVVRAGAMGLFGVGSTPGRIGLTPDLVADVEVLDIRANLGNHTFEIGSRRIWENIAPVGVVAVAYFPVDRLDACRPGFDKDLPWSHTRPRRWLKCEHTGRAMAVCPYGLH